ncbi:MAG: Por secretion system protein, partial [Bacteroidales bacterium]|nr:Por secretion system protein [Bacteroidales bacterium]
MFTRKSVFLCLAYLLSGVWCLNGQVITCDPVFPTDSDSVTIIFNANEGNRGLAGYSGSVYAHTGVITSQSSTGSDWRYVIASWSQNLDKAKLTSLGNDLWELKIKPNIRSFYGVPANVKILKLAFVFRSQDGSRQGKDAGGLDIFQNVYEPGLNLVLLEPSSKFLTVEPQQLIPVRASTSGSDSILLYKDGIKLASTQTRDLSYSIETDSAGLHHDSLMAYLGNQQVGDSFQFYVKGDDFTQELPPGVKDGINYPDAQSAILVLFAPEKDHVFVIGGFTGWKIDPAFLMHRTPDQKRFWLKIENLIPGQEYVFQYLVDDGIRIVDPYSNKV